MTPEEYQLILELGQYDDRSGQLDRQHASFANMRQPGAPIQIGNMHGLSTLLTSIRDAGNSVAGAVGQAGIENQQQKLLQRRAAGRAAGTKLAQGPALDASGLFVPGLGPDELATLEASLRSQIDDRERNARLLMASGDPVLMQQGQAMAQQIQDARGQIMAAPEKRLARAKAKAEFDRQNGPATTEHHMLAQKYQTQIPQGATVAQAEQILEVALKGFEAGNKQRALDIDAARLEQDAFGVAPNPTGSGFLKFNKKTGEHEWIADGPSGGANQLGRPTEQQKNKVANSSANVQKLELALKTLEQNPGAYGGATNFVAGAIERAAPDFLTPPIQSVNSMRMKEGELQAKNFVTNVVSEIIKDRAGGSVTLNEELRQKFLPQETDSLEVAKQKLRDLKTWEQMTVNSLTGQSSAIAAPASRESAAKSGAPAPVRSPDSYYE